MDSPARAARRLIVGSGLGLVLVTGLALQKGLLDPSQPSFDLIVPFAALCLLLIGTMGQDSISRFLPDEAEGDVVTRMNQEVAVESKTGDVGDAWARLEADLLSKEVREAE